MTRPALLAAVVLGAPVLDAIAPRQCLDRRPHGRGRARARSDRAASSGGAPSGTPILDAVAVLATLVVILRDALGLHYADH
jgi:hypothetical protein